MADDLKIKAEFIAELQEAIQAASRDYFLWSKGRTLYDDGVETLMHVYAAKRLFDLFASQYGVEVRLERKLAELNNGAEQTISGRADLTLQFDSGFLYIVEFKRYLNPASIRDDINRLRKLIQTPDRIGILAAPCFIKENEVDWPEAYAREREHDQSLKVHLSEPRFLPTRFHHPGRWDRNRALVIEVGR